MQVVFSLDASTGHHHVPLPLSPFAYTTKHHFLVDLAPFGLDNPNEVFYAADRPYGLIEATVLREGAPAADKAWAGIAGFC